MTSPRVTVLAGGVGGAKLAHGAALAGADLTVIVNTADDTELYGLHISPDLDTVMYTLAGLADRERGWGLAGESYTALDAAQALGEDTWFLLGDKDLGTHLVRTGRLRAGERLHEVTASMAAALGIGARLLPMTDDRVRTFVDTPTGRLSFQDYFVGRKHADEVLGVVVAGVEDATAAPGVLDALTGADVVVLAPSNPFVSIGPVLEVPGVRDALADSGARRVGVSPIVGGQAIKGPAADMLASLGHEVSALGVARLYVGMLDAWCLDEADAHLAPAVAELGMRPLVTASVMRDDADRERLARELLAGAAA